MRCQTRAGGASGASTPVSGISRSCHCAGGLAQRGMRRQQRFEPTTRRTAQRARRLAGCQAIGEVGPAVVH